MEDFIEIIFYIILFVLSGIGSLIKNSKKKPSNSQPVDSTILQDVDDSATENEYSMDAELESEFIKMVRDMVGEELDEQCAEGEVCAINDEVSLVDENRVQEKIEQERNIIENRYRCNNESLFVSEKMQHIEQVSIEELQEDSIDVNFSDIDDVRRAFIASEIFNKKYC